MKLYWLLVTIIAVIGFSLVIVTATTSIDRSERAECLKWQSQAQKFPGYYLTKWQSNQCAAHDIAIAAPVR